MPNTQNFGLPYPLESDPADVPADMQRLAAAVDLFELGYAQMTSGTLSVTATTEPTGQVVVAAPAITFDGTTIATVEFFSPRATPPTSVGNTINLALFQDGVSLGVLGVVSNPAAGAMGIPVHARRRLVPAAGSRTYDVRAYVSAGSGSVAGGAGGPGIFLPAFIRVGRV